MHEALLFAALLAAAHPARPSSPEPGPFSLPSGVSSPALLARQQPPAPTPTPAPAPTRGEWYVSWGYNTAQYAKTDMHFVQAGSGNDFTLHGVKLGDSKAWDIWNHEPTVPQYSWRVGKFIKPNLGLEFSFDHAKALLGPGQHLQMTGTLNGASVDQQVNVDDIVQVYKLNNGANFALINVVWRFRMHGTPGRTGGIALLAKAGGGFMTPHTENVVLGMANEAGFQYGGLGAGIEGGIRAHVYKMIYVDVAEKGFYGHYRNLHIHDGAANHDLWAAVTIISFGSTFNFPSR